MKAGYLRLFLLVGALGFFGSLSCGGNGKTTEVTPVESSTVSIGTPERATATPKAPSATPASSPTEKPKQPVTSRSDALGCGDYVRIPRPPGPFRIGSCSLPSPNQLRSSSLTYVPYEDYVSFDAMTAAADQIGTFYFGEMPKHGWVLASSGSHANCDSEGHCDGEYKLGFATDSAELVPLEGATTTVDFTFSEYTKGLTVQVGASHPKLQTADASMFVHGD